MTPRNYFPTLMRFFKAYNYDNSLLSLVRGFAGGSRLKVQPEALIFGYSQVLKGWTVMDRLSEIQVPTLVLAGSHDFLFPPECQRALAAGIPSARLEFVERAGHNPQMEQPAEVIIKIENPPGQRVQQVFAGDEPLQPGRHYPTAFVTEPGVPQKYGRNRQQHPERSIEALRAYLARHRPLHAELRGTFVAV